VVTTLDEEHMDHYKTLDNMKNCFLVFLNRIPFYGSAVLCLDDPNIQSLIPKIEKRYITYGLTSQADYTAKNIVTDGMKTRFTVYFQGKELGEIVSCIPGKHNVCNTLASIAVGMELNLTFNTIRDSLLEFSGVHRRFEIGFQSDTLVVVDDYGHHPAEIQATLAAAKEVWSDRRLIVAFQPHRYSRTQHLMEQFCTSFNNADYLIVDKIYAAGEDPIEGIDARQIADGAKKFGHKHVEHIESKKYIIAHLLRLIQPGDVVMTLGAGDIWEVGRDLISKLPKHFR
jgi:UDP-N-acetylmuramate--alanine ligase